MLPYYLSPVFSLFISLLVWIVVPYESGILRFNMGIFCFCFWSLSLGVYSTLRAGWSSNCKYSILGRLRATAQTISYEVRLAIILLSVICLVGSFNLNVFNLYQDKFWLLLLTFPLSIIWLASCLAETNRTPFDFAEGESELVSGFNTAYRRGGFALIFIAEYARIVFLRILVSLILLGGSPCCLLFYVKTVFVSFIFIWVCGTLPWLRYDKLMYLAWKIFLPVSLTCLIFCIGLKIFCLCIIL